MVQFLTMPRSSRGTVSVSVLVTLWVVSGSQYAANSAVTLVAEMPSAKPATLTVAGAELGQNEAGPDGVVNYRRVDATVAGAGATPPEAMAELKMRGFAAIINFRTVGEQGASVDSGRSAAEAAGLKYFHIPFRQPTADVVETFLDTVADPSNQPTYIHCGSANRVGAMWLIKRVQLDGWSIDDATAEAELIGLRSEALKRFALEYVQDGA